MGITERDVGNGDVLFDDAVVAKGYTGVGDCDGGVSEGGAADLAKNVHFEVEELLEAKAVGNTASGLEFASLGALAVTEVECEGLGFAGGEGGSNAAIHTAGETDYGANFEG